MKIRVQHMLMKENCAQIFKVINWAKLALFSDPQFGPVNNFDLAQLTTWKMVIFVFLLLKNAEIPIFVVFFEHQSKFAKTTG